MAASMFSIGVVALFEIAIRVAIVYFACFVLLRMSGRREMSQFGPMDLITLLLLSETVGPAMTAGNTALTGGIAAAAVLFALSVTTSWLAMRSKKLNRVLQGDASILIRDGHVDEEVMRKERLTDEALRAKLHEHGLMQLDEVHRAFVEADGEITFVKRGGARRSVGDA